MFIQTLQNLEVSELLMYYSLNSLSSLGDYISEGFLQLFLPRNTSRICGRINIFNDIIMEDLYENFTVGIFQAQPPISTLRINKNPLTIRIEDDDC